MKKFAFVFVAFVSVVNSLFAANVADVDSIQVNNVQIEINGPAVFALTDMAEFKNTSFVAAFPVEMKSGVQMSDWAYAQKDKKGNYYLDYYDTYLKVSGSKVTKISKAQFDAVEKEFVGEEEFASFCEPMGMAKYKYVWGHDVRNNTYLVVYGQK